MSKINRAKKKITAKEKDIESKLCILNVTHPNYPVIEHVRKKETFIWSER